MLNSYFGSVFSAENGTEVLPEVNEIFKGDSSVINIHVSQETVIKHLNKLQNKKAPSMFWFQILYV